MNFDESKVSYSIEASFDDVPVYGNASDSGDPVYDRRVENKILSYIRDNLSDPWAWAVVTVWATYDGLDGIEGVDFLGCCSYEDEDDFKDSDLYRDMCENAKEDLKFKLGQIVDILS